MMVILLTILITVMQRPMMLKINDAFICFQRQIEHLLIENKSMIDTLKTQTGHRIKERVIWTYHEHYRSLSSRDRQNATQYILKRKNQCIVLYETVQQI